MKIVDQRLVLIAPFAALCAFYLGLGWSNEVAGLGGDDAGYLLAAQYFSPYQPASPILIEYSKQIIYPPLFPWMLAITGAGENILVAHWVVVSFLLMSIVVLYLWLRQSFSFWLSAAIALVFALMPGTYLQSVEIWTENPDLFFSLVAILALDQSGKRETSKWIWLAALAVSCATLIRVAALPLLLAFWIYMLVHRPRNYAFSIALATLPFVTWVLISLSTQTGVSGYLGHWQEKYSASPLQFLWHQIAAESEAILAAWQYAWLGESQSGVAQFAVTAFGVACIAGGLLRLKLLKFDPFYVAIYLPMLLVWPHPEEALRYSYVVYPVLIVQGFFLVSKIRNYRTPAASYPITSWGLIGILGLSLVPSLVINLRHFFEDIPLEIRAAKHTREWYSDNRQAAITGAFFYTRLLGHLKQISQLVPKNECIYSNQPNTMTLYSGRPSYAPPKPNVSDEQFWKGLQKCRYAYVVPFSSPSYADPLYPLARLGDRAKILSVTTLNTVENTSIAGALIEIKPAATRN